MRRECRIASTALYARVRFLLCTLHARPRMQRASGIPCSLPFWRDNETQASGASCRENANAHHHVIASVAKQSISRRVGWAKRKRAHHFCFARDGGHGATRLCPPYKSPVTPTPSRGTMRPRFAFRCPSTGGSRECRMRAASAVSCAKGRNKSAHEHTGQRRRSDIPCAMALRLITRSPRSIGLFSPPSPYGKPALRPGWASRLRKT